MILSSLYRHTYLLLSTDFIPRQQSSATNKLAKMPQDDAVGCTGMLFGLSAMTRRWYWSQTIAIVTTKLLPISNYNSITQANYFQFGFLTCSAFWSTLN